MFFLVLKGIYKNENISSLLVFWSNGFLYYVCVKFYHLDSFIRFVLYNMLVSLFKGFTSMRVTQLQ